MTVLAVIPARGGSKGVPGKNVAPVAGVPLVVRAISAAHASGRVDRVAVSTDDDRIASVAAAAGALVITRPDELAGDQASSETALLHALDTFEAQTGFLWRRDADGNAVGINHDKAVRPRRQDRVPEFLETGAVYAMSADGFRTHRHRFFGGTALIETDPERVLEIDDPADLARARTLAHLLGSPASVPGRADIDAVVLDFDGTQTDDSAQVASDGTEQVRVHRGDGLGIAALRRAGIPVLILSSEVNPVVRARARKLSVPVIHGVEDKGAVLRDWCSTERIDPTRVLYAGNDVNDLGCFEVVGWPVAVASAHPAVRDAARLVTTVPGGHGAVREIASWILGKDLAS